MYKVGVTGNFSAIHALVGDFGEETIPHSHPYRLEWDFSLTALDANGFSLDISRLQTVRDELFTALNGTNLNKEPFFREVQTSLENVCAYIAGELMTRLNPSKGDLQRMASMSVTLWESDDAWAGFQQQFGAPGGIR